MHIKSIIAASLLALAPAGATSYQFNGKITVQESYLPDGIFLFTLAREGQPFHGDFSFGSIHLGGFNGEIPVVDGESDVSVGKYDFSTTGEWIIDIRNNVEWPGDSNVFPPRGADYVQFIHLLPGPSENNKHEDLVIFEFLDRTGTILNNTTSLDGVDLSLFPEKNWQWSSGGDVIGETFEFLFIGDIDRMKLRVPDAGSTLGLLGFAIVGLGFLKRKL